MQGGFSMSNQLATVEQATQALGVTSSLSPNKAITLSEMEDLIQDSIPLLSFKFEPGVLRVIKLTSSSISITNPVSKAIEDIITDIKLNSLDLVSAQSMASKVNWFVVYKNKSSDSIINIQSHGESQLMSFGSYNVTSLNLICYSNSNVSV